MRASGRAGSLLVVVIIDVVVVVDVDVVAELSTMEGLSVMTYSLLLDYINFIFK